MANQFKLLFNKLLINCYLTLYILLIELEKVPRSDIFFLWEIPARIFGHITVASIFGNMNCSFECAISHFEWNERAPPESLHSSAFL